ncbi:MAG: hypothetical protein KAR62_07785 [Sphingomonadales bacterium]|nr:hypothetical protein [Sphingomonadales bacterium]
MAGEEKILPKSTSPFADNYDIDFATRLPQFDSPGGEAYAAASKKDITQSVYAFVHNFEVPMRDSVTDRLIKKTIKFYNNLLDQGVYSAVEEGSTQRRFVSVVERPLGPSLDSAEGRERIDVNFLQKDFLKPLLIALAELHGNKITHRALTPANIFFANPDGNEIILGECFSAPAGLRQPGSYTTLERAACLPMARGEGASDDDVFALGACLMTLAISDPIKTSEDNTVDFFARMDKGSYRFLEGKKRVPDAFELPIRGLMSDEAAHRWGLGQVAQFIDGHAPRLSTGTDNYGLSKPVTFAGVNYTDRRALAQGMAIKIPETVTYFSEFDFANWVSSNLTAEVLSENAELFIKGSNKSHNANSAAELVARLCAFLDPHGPLRYNGLTIAYDGFGPVVAAAYMDESGKTLDIVKDILSSNIITEVSKIIGDDNEVMQENVGSIVWAGGFLKNEKLGQGIERVLYELNPKLPCLSDKFKGYWIRGARGVLKKLDQLIGTSGSGTNLLDRHVSAFCSAKTVGLDGMFGTLPNGDLPSGLHASRFIDTMGAIQTKVRVGPLPNLCSKLCEGLRPVVKAIHYKPRREMLAKRLDQLSSTGSLANVSSQLKLAQHRATDEQEYSRACKAFSHLERMREQNKVLIKSDDPRAVYKGYNGVSFVGMVLVAISVVLTVLGS